MRGEGVSRDYARTRRRTCSGKKTLKSHKVQGNLDNFVIIDVDSDGFDNVIIIDVPESLQQKLRGSNVLHEAKKFPFRGIVCIDDEAVDDVVHLGVNAEGVGEMDIDGNLSDSCPANGHVEKSVDADIDASRAVHNKTRAFKLTKCKNTCSTNTSPRNHYGLYTAAESDSSQSDSSDCEIMEDSFGELREQWEKASVKRRSNVHKSQYGLEDQAVPRKSTERKNKTKQNSENPFFPGAKNVMAEDVISSLFNATEDGFLGGDSFSCRMETSFTAFEQKADEESYPRCWKPSTQENTKTCGKADAHFGVETFAEDNNFFFDELQSVNSIGISVQGDAKSSVGPSGFNKEKGDNACNHTGSFFQGCKHDDTEERYHYEKASVHGQDVPLFEGQCSTEMHNVNRKEFVLEEKDGRCTQAPSRCNNYSNKIQDNCCSSKEKATLDFGEKFVSYAKSAEETVLENVVAPEFKSRASSGESFVQETHKKTGYRDTNKTNCQERSSSNVQCHKMIDRPGTSSMAQPTDSLVDPMCALACDLKAAVQRDIINNREILKETDEYKRAVEEEWAARQQQLKIQAEEAQRLRKRRKAESLRVLEMEKRQKLRVEEVRESQKKDEEKLNMKERLRAEIRKELSKLEIMCIDMASLLRGLGINVGGGFHPSSHEVHAAYKRALLKFHPDRASRSDIHQQVEAEEKFKLISRMKEKFLSTSCQ